MAGDSFEENRLRKLYRLIYAIIIFLLAFVGVSISTAIFYPQIFESNSRETVKLAEDVDPDKIENGIHVRTGLVEAEGLMIVVRNCTNCHSAKLITQNRMTAERWHETIDWMQETQNLGDLGSNQDIIVNYLVTNYPPSKKGRRMVLKNIEWYELED